MSPDPKKTRREEHSVYNHQDNEHILMLRKRNRHIDSPSPPGHVSLYNGASKTVVLLYKAALCILSCILVVVSDLPRFEEDAKG